MTASGQLCASHIPERDDQLDEAKFGHVQTPPTTLEETEIAMPVRIGINPK